MGKSDIRLLTFRLTVRGRDAIASAKWPGALGFIVITVTIAATTFYKTVIMTPGQSRALEVGYRVIWKSDPKDTGTVVGRDWATVTIKWDNGKTSSHYHNDMRDVESKV